MLTAEQCVAPVKAIGGRSMNEIVLRVEGEYREMPGLSLTLPQAARLWGLDHDTCELALTELIERRVLTRGLNGTYIRSGNERTEALSDRYPGENYLSKP